jgi:hypothetical protein
MCLSLLPEQFDGFDSYLFSYCLSIIARCLGIISIQAPKMEAPQMGQKVATSWKTAVTI